MLPLGGRVGVQEAGAGKVRLAPATKMPSCARPEAQWRVRVNGTPEGKSLGHSDTPTPSLTLAAARPSYRHGKPGARGFSARRRPRSFLSEVHEKPEELRRTQRALGPPLSHTPDSTAGASWTLPGGADVFTKTRVQRPPGCCPCHLSQHSSFCTLFLSVGTPPAEVPWRKVQKNHDATTVNCPA